MPVLQNPKHEKFAQELAKGQHAGKAYALAGYKPSDANASKLAKKVRHRVLEITTKAAEKTGITVERILNELAKIGFANMQDYMRIGADGDPYTDFSKLTRDQAAAVQEITVEDFKEGRGENARDVRRVRFKLHDKRAALVDMGKHLGMFIERHEHGGVGEFQRLTDQELYEQAIGHARAIGIQGEALEVLKLKYQPIDHDPEESQG
jgi:phage terminase small subunit